MKRPRGVDHFLADIVLWGEKAQHYVAGLTGEDFYERRMVVDAVTRCIEVVGEAAHQVDKIDPSIAKSYPDFDVDSAYGARNVIAHAYNEVEDDIVWITVTQSLPKLILITRRIIAERSSRQS